MKKRSKNTNIYDKINLRNRKKRANIHTLTTKLIYEIEKKRAKNKQNIKLTIQDFKLQKVNKTTELFLLENYV